MNQFHFKGKNGCNYVVSLLTEKVAKDNTEKIEKLLKDIKGAVSDFDFIIGYRQKHRLFMHKWKLSYFCADISGNIVAVVISYFHLAEDVNPFDSVYIHRIAVAPEHRRNHVAFNCLKIAITNYFSTLHWLRTVSVQVTRQPRNLIAEKLYKKLGFTTFGSRYYANKTDSILILRDSDWVAKYPRLDVGGNSLSVFNNPRFNTPSNNSGSPIFYVSSGSNEKRSQLSWLMSLYNIRAVFHSPPMDLIEPQLESMDKESQVLLVSHPLKQIARFIGPEKTPFVIEDTMLFIERFNKDFDTQPELPGLDTKRWWRQLGNEGVLSLLGSSSKRRAIYVSQVGCYLGSGKYLYGRGELKGRISLREAWVDNPEQKFPITNSLFFHKIFIPNGFDKTLGELNGQDFTCCDYRRKSFEDLLAKMMNENMESPVQESFAFEGFKDGK